MRIMMALFAIVMLLGLVLSGCAKKAKVEPPRFSTDKLSQLKVGMTYQEVKTIMGAEGIEASVVAPKAGTQTTPDKTKIYDWKNTSTTAIRAMFNDDKLIQPPLSIPLSESAVK